MTTDHTGFNDVGKFRQKFGLPHALNEASPALLTEEKFRFRYYFLHEEMLELYHAQEIKDLAKVADALVDLVYVAYGTAHLMGLPWEELWAEVQRANMSKVRADGPNDPRSKRDTGEVDVVKPVGWVAPDLVSILKRHG
jgi:predicted HAD superfamily Cof-like phosphohydrolase